MTTEKTNVINRLCSAITSLVTDHNTDNSAHADIRSDLDELRDSQITLTNSRKAISSNGIYFYVEPTFTLTLTVEGNSIAFRNNYGSPWLGTIGNVIIDWGDGTSNTVNNPTEDLTHTYTDGKQSHNIVFSGNIISLGDYCFDNCTGLTSITIPDSVTSLGEGCFIGCTGLTSITIPDSVTSLGEGCFIGCTGLTSITIPDSVTSLGEGCFMDCTGLTSVVISNSVTSIGEGCFTLCSSLIDYRLYWTSNNIITYKSTKMPNNTYTIFTIPQGETANYVAKSYPSDKLVEERD